MIKPQAKKDRSATDVLDKADYQADARMVVLFLQMAPQAEKTEFVVDDDIRKAGLLSRRKPAAAGSTAEGPVKKFTKEEVAKHDRPEDCWMIIRGKVYDVTAW